MGRNTVTLYRDDPRYISADGIRGIQLRPLDAMVDILDDVDLAEVDEVGEILFKVTEARGESGNKMKPIDEQFGLQFSYIHAYGFLLKVLEVTEVEGSPKDQKQFRVLAIFDPHESFVNPPLTATVKNGVIELDRHFDHEIPSPVAYREKGKKPRVVKLELGSDGYLHVKGKSLLEEGERVRVVVNWDPSAVQSVS